MNTITLAIIPEEVKMIQLSLLHSTHFLIGLIIGVLVAIAAAIIGVFVILQRMALVGDALSHVALPGIGLAVILGINPFIGALIFMLIGVLGVALIRTQGKLSIDAIVGVFFIFALGLGSIIAPSAESLLESLFGTLTKLTLTDGLIGLILGIAVLIASLKHYQEFAKLTLSPDLAQSENVAVNREELFLLLLLALIVAAGIKVVGILLIGALVIVPASAAKNLAKSLRGMTVLSVIFGVASVVSSLIISALFAISPGPLVAISNGLIFIGSLANRK